MLLYVMNEDPSLSETFVVTEASALDELGVPVVGYALRRGAAQRAAASIDFLCPPPGRVRLAWCGLRTSPRIAALLWRTRGEGLTLGERTRLAYALAHGAHVAPAARAAGVDHVHAHFLARPADVAGDLAQRLGCRWTATAHGSDVYTPGEPQLLRRRLRDVDAVACASRSVQATLEVRSPKQVPSSVVHCGVDTRSLRFVPRAGARPKRRQLLTVGRLVAMKGHWTIVEAATSLLREDPSLHWTVVGDGPLREQLTTDPRVRDLGGRLAFVGPLDHDAALELLEQADLFVLPCEREPSGSTDGIPVALMEAMALGVPVVTTLIGGIAELVEHRVTGVLVAPQDPVGLVATLQELLYGTDTTDLDRLRDAARGKVEDGFDQLGEARALVELLRPHMGSRALDRAA